MPSLNMAWLLVVAVVGVAACKSLGGEEVRGPAEAGTGEIVEVQDVLGSYRRKEDGRNQMVEESRLKNSMASPVRDAGIREPVASMRRSAMLVPLYVSRYGIDWSMPNLDTIDLSANYYFIREIGKGAFSTVILAIDIQNNRTIALKLIKKIKAGIILNLAKIVEKELDILTKLPNHPNICQFYGYKDFPGVLAIELEYVKGLDLKAFVTRRSMVNESMARDIMKQAISGIKVLEDAGIYHLDIKLGNIMREHKTGAVKIIDFGITMLSNKLVKATYEQPLAGIGSIEVAQSNSYQPKPAIVWLLGLTLFQIVAKGHFPFRRYLQIPSTEHFHKKAYKIMPHITEEVLKLIEKMPKDLSTDQEYPMSAYIIARLDVLNKRYTINRFWSQDLRDLFSKIFVHAEERITLEEMGSHRWFSI